MKRMLLIATAILFITPGISAQTFDKVWETAKIFKTPESVYYDAERNQMYVSNINGKPTAKDNNGFISIMDTTGRVKKLRWIRKLNAPKGMAVIDSLLYVTDIDRIVVINIMHDRIVKIVTVEGAVFLNDIVALPSGKLIVSDMKMNRLLEFDGEKARIWMENDLLTSPNGLAFRKGALFIGTDNSLLKYNLETENLKVHISETGPVDGLIPLGMNKFVISDWAGRILIAGVNDKIVLQNTSSQNIQAADLGFLPDEKIVLIPTFTDNRVVARRLP